MSAINREPNYRNWKRNKLWTSPPRLATLWNGPYYMEPTCPPMVSMISWLLTMGKQSEIDRIQIMKMAVKASYNHQTSTNENSDHKFSLTGKSWCFVNGAEAKNEPVPLQKPRASTWQRYQRTGWSTSGTSKKISLAVIWQYAWRAELKIQTSLSTQNTNRSAASPSLLKMERAHFLVQATINGH